MKPARCSGRYSSAGRVERAGACPAPVGTDVHAVHWLEGAPSLDVDFAHAGRNASLARAANRQADAQRALPAREMRLLQLTRFDGKVDAPSRNAPDPVSLTATIEPPMIGI